MKTNCLGVIVALLLSFTAFAQQPEPFDSRKIIEKGIQLHDQEKYRQAVDLFRQVPKNDTNYVWSLYETAYSQYFDSSFNESIKTVNLALSFPDNEYELQLYTIKGSILDEIGEWQESIRVYDTAISRFPNSLNLPLNKGIVYQRQKQYDKAMLIFQDILVRNPFMSSAHYRLAQCALNKGQVIPATMSLFTYLVNDPDGQYSNAAIKLLNGIANSNDDVLEFVSNRSTEAGGFAMLEKIVLSKIALDKNYKLMIGLDDPITRQLQVMLEKMQYRADDDNFWMQFYVPTLKAMFDKKNFEPIVYLAFSDVDLPAIKQYCKRNEKEIKKAAGVFVEDMERIRTTRQINFNSRQSAPALYHYEDGRLFAKGKMENDKVTGPWEFYHENGNMKSKGEFNSNGKKQGKWMYYYDNGQISGYDSWENGVQTGEDVVYNRWGLPATRAQVVNGKIDGIKETFYAVGQLMSRETYKNGVQDGSYTEYYANTRKKVETTYSNDQINGNYKYYYQNGNLSFECVYTNGKMNGSYKSYHENGKLSFEGNYVNGELEGPAKAYHDNGVMSRNCTYRKSAPDGDYQEFDRYGQLETKMYYKNGKADGVAEYYDNGKMYSTFTFANDKLKEAKYFNKAGREISSSTRDNKQIELTTFTPEGVRTSRVTYNDKGEKQDKQVYYFSNGSVKETDPYVNGEMEGIATTYYPNGTKEYEISYKGGKKHGPYKSYFINGQIKYKGWYIDDVQNGDWYEYNEKGNLESYTYYLEGEIHGTRQLYMASGKLDYEEDYKNGWVLRYRQFDTTGKVVSTANFKQATGTYKGIYPNGKTRYESQYLNGYLHGQHKMYYFDGSVQTAKNFDHGDLHGDYTEYHFGNKIAVKGQYNKGMKTGRWEYFAEEGHKYRSETYENGELEGKSVYYFTDGKTEREFEFHFGKKDGAMSRYAEDGQLVAVYYYKNDRLIGYAAPDATGKLQPMTALKAETGKININFPSGKPAIVAEFFDGMRNGNYKLYHTNGQLYYELNEIFDISHGKMNEFTPAGVQRSDYNYFYGNQDGAYKEKWDNGQLKEEGNFFNGYLHGLRKMYDKNGKLAETRLYYYGLLLNVTK